MKLVARWVITLSAAFSSSALAQDVEPHEPRPVRAATVAEARADEAAAFLQRARTATARFRDRRAAISDGYRRLGPDFPFGGEHWVSPWLVIRGRLVAEQPQALLYVDSAGTPVLVGVAYAIPLEPGAPPPDFPAVATAWHDHWNTIVEESVRPHAPGGHDHAPPGPRLTMLHAWLDGGNPAGTFALENLALPFRRLGLRAPTVISADAAHAMSLATGGDVFYARMLDAAVGVRSGSPSVSAARLIAPRARALEIVAGIPAGRLPGADDLARLAEIWRQLTRTVASELGPEAVAALP